MCVRSGNLGKIKHGNEVNHAKASAAEYGSSKTHGSSKFFDKIKKIISFIHIHNRPKNINKKAKKVIL